METVCVFGEGFFVKLVFSADFVKSDFVAADFDAAVFGAAVFGAAEFVVFCAATVVVFGFVTGFGVIFLTVAVVFFGLEAAFFGAGLEFVFAFGFADLKSLLLLPKSCPKT